MERIELWNRDYQKIWMEEVLDEWWKLKSKEPYILEYIRILTEDDGQIYAVDPPGGPFISVGHEIEGYKVIEIKNTSLGIFVRLKPLYM